VGICVATHYEGDPCDNYKQAYKWLNAARKDKCNKELFKGVHFFVFGLGDSSYEQFNAMGKFFNETFEELGATRVFKYGEGNAEGNKTEDDFNTWKGDIWSDLVTLYQS
jgi:NADPH-ferrihemoprotein reductase